LFRDPIPPHECGYQEQEEIMVCALSVDLRTARPAITRFLRQGLVLVLTLCTPSIAMADAVSDWNGIATTVDVTFASRAPGATVIDLAYVHIAIYDAVNAMDKPYQPFAVTTGNVLASTSEEAAVAAAAYTVLKALFPTLTAEQQSWLDDHYAAALAAIPGGPSKTDGIALGTSVAMTVLSQRAGDGRNADVTYTFFSGPGQYQRTPPAFGNPLIPWAAVMRPFALVSASQFRAGPPPALTSPEWSADYNETKLLGQDISAARTPEQTAIGRFYGEHAGMQFSRNLRQFAAEQHLSLADNARLFAQLYVTTADSIIACWDSKFFYNRWRPITAIRAGDTDGNRNTDPDPDWSPWLPTPAHPEYPAAHGCFTGSYAEGLADFFATKDVTITLTSLTSPDRPSVTFTRTDDLIHEIIDARIYGGIHFRTSVVRGVVIGRQVAHWVSQHYFQPVE
jgi:hypothetical protein